MGLAAAANIARPRASFPATGTFAVYIFRGAEGPLFNHRHREHRAGGLDVYSVSSVLSVVKFLPLCGLPVKFDRSRKLHGRGDKIRETSKDGRVGSVPGIATTRRFPS